MRGITELLDSLTPEKRLLIIGSAFVDVIVHVPRLPLSGEDVEGTSRQQLVGGCAYNAADVLYKLGLPFEPLIPVGEGMIADRVLRLYPDLGDNGWCPPSWSPPAKEPSSLCRGLKSASVLPGFRP